MKPIFNNTSIGTRNFPINVGSVGGFFTFESDEDVYGITNFHVIQNNGRGVLNDPVYQLGRSGQIGEVEYWYEPTDRLNYFDLALFKIDLAVVQPMWHAVVEGFADAALVRQVELNKNNSVTFGICDGIVEGPFNITINDESFRFSNLLRIQSAVSGAPFSNRGDSGSIIMSDNKIVALLIGADPNDATVSYGIPFVDSRKNKGILHFLNRGLISLVNGVLLTLFIIYHLDLSPKT
jgi:hypothetical protein